MVLKELVSNFKKDGKSLICFLKEQLSTVSIRDTEAQHKVVKQLEAELTTSAEQALISKMCEHYFTYKYYVLTDNRPETYTWNKLQYETVWGEI